MCGAHVYYMFRSFLIFRCDTVIIELSRTRSILMRWSYSRRFQFPAQLIVSRSFEYSCKLTVFMTNDSHIEHAPRKSCLHLFRSTHEYEENAFKNAFIATQRNFPVDFAWETNLVTVPFSQFKRSFNFCSRSVG